MKNIWTSCIIFSTLSLVIIFMSCSYSSKILLTILEKKEFGNTENSYKTSICMNKADAFVILGGGVNGSGLLSESSKSRVLSASKFILKFSSSKNTRFPIVMSGGRKKNQFSMSEAKAMKNYLSLILKKKIDNYRIITEENSLTTYDNALYTKNILQDKFSIKNIILVTNSFHMNRAALTFQKQGFNVCPVAVSSHFLIGIRLFSFENIIHTKKLIHEYVGLVFYSFLGWV